MGAKTQARRLSPEAIVVVDVDFATDYPGMDVKRTGGEVKLGGGPVIARGTAATHACSQSCARWRRQKASPFRFGRPRAA